jgi:hypothetical protein
MTGLSDWEPKIIAAFIPRASPGKSACGPMAVPGTQPGFPELIVIGIYEELTMKREGR